MNWNKGNSMFGSMESWGKKSVSDLPDTPIPVDQLQKIREKFEAAKNFLEKYKTPSQKLHMQYKNAKRKIEITSQISKESQNFVKRTPVNRELASVTLPSNNISKIWTLYLVKLHGQKKNLKKLI